MRSGKAPHFGSAFHCTAAISAKYRELIGCAESRKSGYMNGMKYRQNTLMLAIAVAGLIATGSQLSAQDTGIQALAHRPAPSPASTGGRGARIADLFGE